MVISEKKFFRMTFMSNERYDGSGFVGTYHFTDNLQAAYASAVGAGRKIKIFSADSDPDEVIDGSEGKGGGVGSGSPGAVTNLSCRAIYLGKLAY